MAERKIPENTEAEQALLGSMINHPDIVDYALSIVQPEDFYRPIHQAIFVGMESLWQRGEAIDTITIVDEVARNTSYDRHALIDAVMPAATTGIGKWNVERYSKILVDLAGRRKLIAVHAEMAEGIKDEVPTEQLVDTLRASLEGIGADHTVTVPDGLEPMDMFLEAIAADPTPWLIPGLIKADWRAMIVASEGSGKTVLLRQLAFAASAGLHPLHQATKIEPVRTLIVDLENPRESVESICRPMYEAVRSSDEWDNDNLWIFHRPGGINLRNRADRTDFEAVIRTARPDLVCFGPIYKSYEVKGIGEEEIAVREVTAIFDDLRTRYQFGLILEHHAPHGEDEKRRSMRPHGSVLWKRWPELGIGMTPDKEDKTGGSFRLSRFRGDRLENQWPWKLYRTGTAWPWGGVWEDGMFTSSGPRFGDRAKEREEEIAPF